MAKPGKDGETEEVLASIRDLVAHANRSGARPEGDGSDPAERLVLTPALRVGERDAGGDGTAEPEDTPDDVGEAPQSDGSRTERAPLRLEATREDASTPPRDRGFSDSFRGSLVASMAGLEAAKDTSQAEPDQPSGAMQDSEVPETDRLSDRVSVALMGAVAEESAERRGSDDVRGKGVEPDIAALLRDAGLDEAALRALVARMVREELRGPLGERITRNVRKLVRREVYRILASRDFE